MMEMLTAGIKPAEEEKVAEVNHGMEAVTTITEPHFRKKKGSVIPKKKSDLDAIETMSEAGRTNNGGNANNGGTDGDDNRQGQGGSGQPRDNRQGQGGSGQQLSRPPRPMAPPKRGNVMRKIVADWSSSSPAT
ncbi:hypothetical protein GH714_022408 [Hevea brasiliensis]|uniref:Uncharacterized protein n=1 Tax=Hevea brasiliensis TaxID=3981 RepID=A0A6A6KSX0_HEVBR|nr:hypothetical protein GH714_022408 [Hevea brasiliensis]